MATVGDSDEKTFIRNVLSRYARTATKSNIDDCMVVDMGADNIDRLLVYSIDHPSKIRRLLPADLEWRFYGRWVAACTCGDVIAMGAQPIGFALDLSLTLEAPIHVVEELYSGIRDVLDHYGASFDGGNIDVGNSIETVGVAWGVVKRDQILRRSGSGVGDVIAVTASPGIGWSSYLASVFGYLDDAPESIVSELRNYNAFPTAPLSAILSARAISDGLTAGMDLTDGIIEFLYTIEETSGLGVILDERLLPVAPSVEFVAKRLKLPPRALTLDPGYDTPRIHGYTIKRSKWQQIKNIFDDAGAELYPIGEVRSEPGVFLLKETGESTPVPKFWDDQFDKERLLDRWFELSRQLFGARRIRHYRR